MSYKVGSATGKYKPKRRKPIRNPKTKSFKYKKYDKYSKKNRKPRKTSSRLFSFGSKKSKKKQTKFQEISSKALGILLGLLIVGLIGGAIFAGSTLAAISASLPDPNKLIDRTSDQSTKIYDRGGPDDGELLYTIYADKNREFVELDSINDITKWSLLAAEDIEFYDHKGIDLPGFTKAVYNNVILGKESGGASTIGQQLVRNTLLVDVLGQDAFARDYSRKIKEILMTMQIEQKMSKDDILQMYMNEVYLGGTNYGFQAAAKAYFNKDVDELTLAESALIAGIIQAPSYYSPLFGSNPEEAKNRQTYVLDQLYAKRDYIAKTSEKHGEKFDITEEMIEEAKNQELVYSTARIDIKAPHFVFYVKQQLVEEYGQEVVEKGGLNVTTTLDYSVQQIAEEEIVNGVDKYRDAYNVHNGSMVVMDPRTGQILSLVGSYDYWADPDPRVDGNVNIATAPRQMGSSVKPYTYLTAFSKGYSPALLTPDIPLDFGNYKPENWDGRYDGLILAREALVKSRNIPALYTLDLVGGPSEFIKTAEKLGITTLTDVSNYGLSLTLGAGEMKLLEHVGAFSVFANGGEQYPMTSILKVENYQGDILEEWDDNKIEPTEVWDEKEIYLLNWATCDLANQGRITTQYYSVGSQKLCGKTGTTNGPKDLSAILYYPNLVVGVWNGNNNNEITMGNAGQAWSTTVPLPIAHSFMSRIIGKYGQAWYSRPAGVVSGTVCKDTGLLADSDTQCEKVSSVFIQGKLPEKDTAHDKKPICKETGKVATNEDDAKAMDLIEYKTYLDIVLDSEKHQDSLDKWLKNNNTYKSLVDIPDEEICPLHLGPDNAPVIELTTPADNSSYQTGDSIDLSVSIKTLPGVKKVVYEIDSTEIASTNVAPYNSSYVIPSSLAEGNHTLIVRVIDNDDKESEISITISISTITEIISLEITEPANASTVSRGSDIIAKLTDGEASSVSSLEILLVNQSDGAILYSYEATKILSNQWSVEIPIEVLIGDYTVTAHAINPSGEYVSPEISLTIN